MRIGYSHWGFLGTGITDTPDGGRSHRRVLVDGLIHAGHDITFLQANRDLVEAGDHLDAPIEPRSRQQGDRQQGRSTAYTRDDGFPELDALFLEWRWPIQGRNTMACDQPGHTCDLHRQSALLQHFTHKLGTPTLIWDKDLQLPATEPLRQAKNVRIFEAALFPSPDATSLRFPVEDHALDAARPEDLARQPRTLPLTYVGNQYDRNEAFGAFFAPAAVKLDHRVAGKWTRTQAWPWVNFTGRCPFPDVAPLYRRSLATVLLAPERYARVGQMTQRLVESVLNGCVPLTPATFRGAAHFTPAELHVSTGQDVITAVRRLQRIAGTPAHVDLIAACLEHLGIFRRSAQIATIEQALQDLRGAS